MKEFRFKVLEDGLDAIKNKIVDDTAMEAAASARGAARARG